jgi:pimeloyl-ACP methyl ester carboxylesterase
MTNAERLVLDLMTPERRAPRASDVAWDARVDVAARGGAIATWSAGRGPAVLLAHGWETDHADMDAFVAPLVAAGRRVTAFDLPAHGESAGDRASLLDLAAGLADTAAALGPLDAIVAHSVGCAASAIALANGLRVRKVAFVAPPLRYADFVRFYAERHGIAPEELAAAFAGLGIDITQLDIRTNAATLDVPLLIVHSTDDRVCASSNATKIAAVWKKSSVELREGLGHARILRDPDVVARIVAFVTG